MFLAESLTCNLLFGGLAILATVHKFPNLESFIPESALYVLQLLLVSFLWWFINYLLIPPSKLSCKDSSDLLSFLSSEKSSVPSEVPPSVTSSIPTSVPFSAYLLYSTSAALCAISMRQSIIENSIPLYVVTELLVIPILACVTSLCQNPGIPEAISCTLILLGEWLVFYFTESTRTGIMAAGAEICFLTAQQLVLVVVRTKAKEEKTHFNVIDFHVKTAPLQAIIVIMVTGVSEILLEYKLSLSTGYGTGLITTAFLYGIDFTTNLVLNFQWILFVIVPSSMIIVGCLFLSTLEDPEENTFEKSISEKSTFDKTEDSTISTKKSPNVKILFQAIILSRIIILLGSAFLPNLFLKSGEKSPNFLILTSIIIAYSGAAWHSTLNDETNDELMDNNYEIVDNNLSLGFQNGFKKAQNQFILESSTLKTPLLGVSLRMEV